MKTILVLPLLAISVFAQSQYDHLSLEWAKSEAVRITYMNRQQIYDTISKQKYAVQILTEKHDEVVKTDGQDAWKAIFEEKYADDFDRALVTSQVCKIIHGEDDEKCATTLKWDHQYDTRDATLKADFVAEVEKAVKDAVELRITQYKRRTMDEL